MKVRGGLAKELDRYFYSVLYDRGLNPGFALLAYVRGVLSDFIVRHNAPIRQDITGETITFGQLEQITKVRLVVTGTNLTHRRPAYFSSKHTEDFPVADAVAISMSFPIFKPVWVFNNPKDFGGFWADGGVLNNLPIHAFDRPNSGHLNPAVLGLRLDEDRVADPRILSDPVGAYGPGGLFVGMFDELGTPRR